MSGMLVVLVHGRGALAKLAGVPSVERHVHAGESLGRKVVVVFPDELVALGVELQGICGQAADCLPASRFAAMAEGRSDDAIAVSAEWYLSAAAMAAAESAQAGPGQHAARFFGRAIERGSVAIPVARVASGELAALAGRLHQLPAASLLASLDRSGAVTLDLDPADEQRLSDNVSTAHAEGKLMRNLFGGRAGTSPAGMRSALAPRLARAFHDTRLGPVGISATKLMAGLGAALLLQSSGWAGSLAAAVLLLGARLVGAAGAVLAQASFVTHRDRDRLEAAGDGILFLAVAWAIAGPAHAVEHGVALAVAATLGAAATACLPRGASPDDAASRAVHREGFAWAMLLAALVDRLDLLLWAAALASHLEWMFALAFLRDRNHPAEGANLAAGPAA